jgi:5-methylcytosine-specific restriction enzyme subunit McrC
MLAVGGNVPVRSRDMARLTSRRAPLSETLAAVFAERLLAELLRGPERAYLRRQENLRRFKGKLVVAAQARRNAAHRERFVCRFDEFSRDTSMNRIFRAACAALLDATRTPATQDLLRHCLLLLDDVADTHVHRELFDRVVFTRQNERFEDVFEFCRLVLSGRSPTAEGGDRRSFSLLFDMNQVFERFVAGFLRTRVLPRMDGYRLFPQAKRRRRHLMSSAGRGVLPLHPDLLIEAPDASRIVIDTKWKRLSAERARGGLASADLYQLFAYLRRYGCRRSFLLYPHLSTMSNRDFDVLDRHDALSGEQVGVRFVRLHRNLHLESERSVLANELHELLAGAFAESHGADGIPGTGGAA